MQDLIQGEVASGYGAVADAFRRNFTDQAPTGTPVQAVPSPTPTQTAGLATRAS